MQIHFVPLRAEAVEGLLELHAQSAESRHTLTSNPAQADMIVFAGGSGTSGLGLLDHPLPRLYPEKCFHYWDDDHFLPLLPGIYTNAERSPFNFLHRAGSQMWVTALNPAIGEATPDPIAKKYLFSFAGGSTSLLRKKLYKMHFSRPDILIENTSDYYHWDPSQAGRAERQRQYARTIRESHFGLCPRGASAGSLRLFEIMEQGVCPVLVSDTYLLPEGPDWASFLIRVPESKLNQLDRILTPFEHESAARGALARQAWDVWFAAPVRFNRIIEALESYRTRRRIPERLIHPLWRFILLRKRLQSNLRGTARALILATFKLLRIPFLYDLNKR